MSQAILPVLVAASLPQPDVSEHCMLGDPTYPRSVTLGTMAYVGTVPNTYTTKRRLDLYSARCLLGYNRRASAMDSFTEVSVSALKLSK